jgi:hypothetical protein
MKLDKENYTLTLGIFPEGNSINYEGNFSVTYTEKLFRKTTTLNDTAHISEDNRPLPDNENKNLSQIYKLIEKELTPKGFKIESIHIHFNGSEGSVDIQFMVGEEMNNIIFNMAERHSVAIKSYSLAKSISKRLLKELK